MLNLQDLSREATDLGCEIASLRAVAEVESAGSGFLADGRPKILFEAHIFSQRTKRRWDHVNPSISSPTWNRALYKGGAAEYVRLEHAKELDATAALESASWGTFQIMGFNARVCGFADVHRMVEAMQTEAGQLRAFGRFIASNPAMAKALRARDWKTFARLYNGPGQVPVYAARIEDAYRRYKGEAGPVIDLPAADLRAPPEKGLAASKSVIVGGISAAGGVAGLADQASTISYAIGSATTAVQSATGFWGVVTALGPIVPWLLTALCVGGLIFVLWRYVFKVRRGEAVVR